MLQRILDTGLITTRDFVFITDNGTRYFRGMLGVFDDKYFRKHRFRFLSDFYPEEAVISRGLYKTSLYVAAEHRTIDAFRCVFATGLSLYPKKKGINLLHQKGPMSKSPYMIMCDKLGRKATGALIHETLQSYNFTPYDPVEAFLYAAIDNTVRLDGVYSMLRTHPDILLQLQLSLDTSTTSTSTSDTDSSTTASLSVPAESKRKHRKRKREKEYQPV